MIYLLMLDKISFNIYFNITVFIYIVKNQGNIR